MEKNTCPFCGRPRKSCLCEAHPYLFDGAEAAMYYHGKGRELIHQFKFQGRRELAPLLGILMAGRVEEALSQHRLELVIPVPMGPSELKKRKYNHSALLAREIGRSLGLRYEEKALVKIRQTPHQRLLDGEERRKNLAGAFSVDRKVRLEGKIVLLADDVLTTGSTVNECARALKEAGAGEVYCITACATLITAERERNGASWWGERNQRMLSKSM